MSINQPPAPLPKKPKNFRQEVGYFLKILVGIGCFAGFVWLCHGQFQKFISSSTLEITSWVDEHLTAIPLPKLIFCLKDPFKPEVFNLSVVLMQDQEEYTLPIEFEGIDHLDTAFTVHEIDAADIEEHYIQTLLNGRCKVVNLKKPIEPGSSLVFMLPRATFSNLILYAVRDEEEIFASISIFTRVQSPIYMDGIGMHVHLFRDRITLNPSKRCLDEGYGAFIECLIDKAAASFKDQGLDCVHPYFHSYFANYSLPACNVSTQANQTLKSAETLVKIFGVDYESLCSYPCERLDYRTSASPVAVPPTNGELL